MLGAAKFKEGEPFRFMSRSLSAAVLQSCSFKSKLGRQGLSLPAAVPVSMGLSVFRLSVLPSEGWPPSVILIGCSDRRPVLTDLCADSRQCQQSVQTVHLSRGLLGDK